MMRKHTKITLMKIKKAAALVLAGALTAAAISGCGRTPADPAAGSSKAVETVAETVAETAAETASEEAQAVVFTDAAGRKVSLQKPAEKIVSGYYITTSMLIALGAAEHVVGIEAKADKRPIYKLAAPELLDLPNVGTAKEFDLEGCAALKPDLVILPKKLTEQADILAELGITAMVVNPESEKELKETIVNIAKATGTTKQSEQILAYYDEKTAYLKALAKQSEDAGQRKPSIYFAGTSGVLRTAGAAMYQNGLITLAGGTNAAAEIEDKGWTNIAYETLLSYDPDVIVIIPEAEYTKQDVLADPQLQDLKAIREGAVYEMPSDIEAWDSPVTSGILGSLWLASIVHPDDYTTDDFEKDMMEFYRSFYGIEPDLN